MEAAFTQVLEALTLQPFNFSLVLAQRLSGKIDGFLSLVPEDQHPQNQAPKKCRLHTHFQFGEELRVKVC